MRAMAEEAQGPITEAAPSGGSGATATGWGEGQWHTERMRKRRGEEPRDMDEGR